MVQAIQRAREALGEDQLNQLGGFRATAVSGQSLREGLVGA